ncbi:MAG: YraN family protein [bacterium]|nr:YraN family protein [bacterium]
MRHRGLRILQRNYRCPHGEIDLVAEDGPTLVFVEVKTRAAESDELPEAALTPRKRHRLCRAARHFMQTFHTGDRLFRFDLVGIELFPDGSHRIHHWSNIINYQQNLRRRH